MLAEPKAEPIPPFPLRSIAAVKTSILIVMHDEAVVIEIYVLVFYCLSLHRNRNRRQAKRQPNLRAAPATMGLTRHLDCGSSIDNERLPRRQYE